MLATLTPKPERMKAALSSFMLATDLSEYLVRKGVPFRETHHISGKVRRTTLTLTPTPSLTLTLTPTLTLTLTLTLALALALT